MSSRLGSFLYDFTFWTSGPYFTLANSLRTEGFRHVPKSGPVLVLANHQSYFDPVLVGLAVRRHLCFLARNTLFRVPGLGSLITTLNAVPIDQAGIGIGGLKTVVQQLHGGRAVLVFPEGTRTPDGALCPLQPGIQLLIKKAQPPIVPVGIAGAYDAWPSSKLLPGVAPLFTPTRAGTIAVAVGPPLDPNRYVDLPRDEFLDDLTKVLRSVQCRAEKLRRK